MTPKLKVSRLRRVMRYIEDHPKQWDQTCYHSGKQTKAHPCGTSHCFAGFAEMLAGYKAVTNDGFFDDMVTQRRAIKWLGLTNSEASDLFDGSNSLRVLQEMVAEICENAMFAN